MHSGFTEFYESFRYHRFYLARYDHLADFWEVNNQLQAKAQAVSMQMRDPERAQVISPNDPDLIMASTFDGEGKNITFTLRLANQMKESAPRREFYRIVAEDAKQYVDAYNEQQKFTGALPR